ncbi:MAG: AAA family ATPase [Deltaproteobacteria bacterium]|nr:AAA family ATPase [Deltaproteobacteria bacterium]
MAALKNGNRTGRLGIRHLHHRVNLKHLKFSTTDKLKVLDGVIEQERALEALGMGLMVRKRTFNIYISGASGTGKSSILKGLLNRQAIKEPAPPDFCLVNNFKHPDEPVGFVLPAGRGTELKRTMEMLIEDLRIEIPKAFHGKVHQERIQRILNEGLEQENGEFVNLSKDAKKCGFIVKSTKDGLVTIPIVDDKPVGSKEYGNLTDEQRAAVEAGRQKLEPLISAFLESTRETEMKVHHKIQEVQRTLGKNILRRHLKGPRTAFADFPEVKAYLEAVEDHMLENLEKFLPDENDRRQSERERAKIAPWYEVNVLVDNSEAKGAPVIFENTPTFFNLVGKIEKRVENGIYQTDFSMVKAGALLRANGGYLVLHARDVLTYPFAWDALKNVLRHQRVQIEEMGENFQFLPTTGLRPDPIPVQCKVILIGSNHLYHLLCNMDEDFVKNFQVKAEFDSMVPRTPDTMMEYARFVATTCQRDDLMPVDRNGVAAVIEYGARQAGASDRITLRFNEILNLLIEADALARGDGAHRISREHVERAADQRLRRISLLADKSVENVVQGTLRVDTEGAEVGVVNGLAVLNYADLTFGRPLRITAKTFQGKAGVVNVEREARLGGNIFNKGVLIISGFMGDRFAQDKPLSLTVSLTVEQSYGSIDGDSASCAELCAILSSLSDVPLRQDLAITGSVSQRGEVQAIGGVNEKIEGFFRVCDSMGLTGTQGVIIPASNVRHLMLNQAVVKAVRERKFHVYAVDSVEQAVKLLTGMNAGKRGSNGRWTPNSVFERAARKLERFGQRPKNGDNNGKKREGNGGDD